MSKDFVLRQTIRDLMYLNTKPEPVEEEIPEYVGDLADMVELSERYAAMLGMLRKQCIENGLSEQAADAYVLMVITKMAQP